jgi:glutaminase
MRQYEEQEIWQRVGKDPSGQPFNSLLQLEIEQGKPRNPFINAGALVVCDMLQSRLSAPRQRMLEIVRQLSGVSDIIYDANVARSEFEHAARNAARTGRGARGCGSSIPARRDASFRLCGESSKTARRYADSMT